MRYVNMAAALAIAAASLIGTAVAAEHESKEDRVSLDQVPAPVRATLKKEGGKLQGIERETEGGQSFYEANILKAGKRYSLHVMDDGTVSKRESQAQERREERREERSERPAR